MHMEFTSSCTAVAAAVMSLLRALLLFGFIVSDALYVYTVALQ
jgi:hypothetical protein